ncbi:MAG: polymer-forming cytoskeletal protein [Proteobacteria bacterium]|nr:polymer-forming cytoskeletal protein [Pseudomonadota bacterium]
MSKHKSNSAPSLLGAGLTVTGDLSTEGEMQIDGTVEGNVHAGKLTVGAQARINGNLHAREVAIRGEVHGSIRADGVHLAQTAKVSGDIVWHNTFGVETGAYFNGQCKHSDKPFEATSAPPAPAASAFEAPHRSARLA